jgi:hypothetical protein
MSLTLQYHVPPLGLLRTTLHDEARTLYECLLDKGEIDRLKRLDHLGVVRRATEGAHHPRWEYITLIMHLVDLTKNYVPEAHLSARALGGRVSSGQELLKMWALLLHLGHLPWTFTAERALLAEVKRSRALRQHLLEPLRDEALRRYARRLIRDENVYRFYHVVAFFRLLHLAEGHPTRTLWIDALKAYCLRALGVVRLADIYHRLRQIAFFVLDSHYTPALAGLDFAELLTDPRRLLLVLDPPDSSSAELLDAIQTHLYETVYLSTEVMRNAASLIPALRAAIRTRARTPFPQLINELVTGRLQDSVGAGPELVHVVNVPFRVSEPFTELLLPEARPLREEAQWCHNLPRDLRNEVAVAVWPFADGRQETVDVFAPHRSARLVEAALAAVLERLGQLYKGDRREHGRLFGREFLQEILYGRIAVAFVHSMLRHLFHGAARWELRPVEGSPRQPAVLVTTRREARTFLSAEVRRLAARHTDEARSRLRELQAARAALQQERGRCFVVALARLLAFDAEGRNIGELDGFWVVLSYGRVRAVIIEAKDPAKRSQRKIRHQLQETLKRLRLWQECRHSIVLARRTRQHPHFGKVDLTFPRS